MAKASTINLHKMILEGFKGLWQDFPITLDDLSNPNSELVTLFYDRLLFEMGVKTEEYVTFLVNSMEYSEAFTDIIYVCAVYINAKNILPLLKVPALNSLTLSDFINPAKRTKTQFLAMMNFLIYANNAFAQTYNLILKDVRESTGKINLMNQEKNEIVKQSNHLALTRDKNNAYIIELKQEHDQVQIQHNNLRIEADQVALKNKAQDVDVKTCEEEENRISKELEEEKAKKEELESLLVDDYEYLLAERDRLFRSLEDGAAEDAAAEQQLNNLLKMEQTHNYFHEKLDKYKSRLHLSTYPKQLSKLNNLKKEFEVISKEIGSLDNMCKDSKQLHEEEETLQEQLLAATSKWNGELKKLQENTMKLNKKNGKLATDLAHMDATDRQYERDLADLREAFTNLYKQILQQEALLYSKFSKFI